MPTMNKENIKATLKTPGWQDILQFFQEEIIEEKDLTKRSLDKRYEDIAIETISRVIAAKIVNKALSKLNKIANESETKKESWK